VRTFLVKLGRRLAPRTLENLRTLSTLDEQFEQGPARFIDYEREIRTLRRDIDELRRDNRRVAELYDAVFEWARANAAAQGIAPPPGNPDATVRRIADEAIRGE
jgi:transposase